MWSATPKQAGAAVDGATKALQEHQRQIRDARDWCRNAATKIVNLKDTVTNNVEAGQQEIGTIEKTAAKTNRNPDAAIRTVVERKYNENAATIKGVAVGLGWKPDPPASPVDRRSNGDARHDGEHPEREESPLHLLRSDHCEPDRPCRRRKARWWIARRWPEVSARVRTVRSSDKCS
jgi:hypothetical protein